MSEYERMKQSGGMAGGPNRRVPGTSGALSVRAGMGTVRGTTPRTAMPGPSFEHAHARVFPLERGRLGGPERSAAGHLPFAVVVER